MKKIWNDIQVEVVQGDITKQEDMEAVVNAANAQLLPGGGVAGAIHRAAGPELQKESAPLGPIRPGEAVLTGAYNLPNRYVIHCLGPVYGYDDPEEVLLADCYRNALRIADQKGIRSVAFPAISTGAFGYPPEAAAGVALRTIMEETAGLKHVKTVRMVLFSDRDLRAHEKALDSA